VTHLPRQRAHFEENRAREGIDQMDVLFWGLDPVYSCYARLQISDLHALVAHPAIEGWNRPLTMWAISDS